MRSALVLVAACLVSSTVFAQTPAQPDPFKNYFFPPELVMAHQSEIGLTEEQRKTLRTEIQQAQGTFTEIQWRVLEQSEQLTKLLNKPSVDEAAVLAQVEKILQLEYTLKRTQVRFMVRIKNALTAEQQAKLTSLRGKDD